MIDIQGLLLDLDGVLVDSLGVIEDGIRTWALAHSLDGEAVLRFSYGRRDREIIEEFLPGANVSKELQEIERFEREMTCAVKARPGAARLVNSIPAGLWGIVSSGSRPVVLARLRSAELPIPDVLVSAEDVLVGKPDPQGYIRGAGLLDIPGAGALVVEDASSGIAAARAGSMTAWGVLAAETADALLASGAERVVDSLEDITIEPVGTRLAISSPPHRTKWPDREEENDNA